MSVNEENGQPTPPSSGDGYPPPSGSPVPTPRKPPRDDERKRLQTAQTLSIVAAGVGPLSLIIGGMLLSGAGLVCAIVALRTLRDIEHGGSSHAAYARRLKRSSIISIVVCSITLCLNAVAAWIMFPTVLNMVETGNYDYSALFGGSGSGNSASTSPWG